MEKFILILLGNMDHISNISLNPDWAPRHPRSKETTVDIKQLRYLTGFCDNKKEEKNVEASMVSIRIHKKP